MGKKQFKPYILSKKVNQQLASTSGKSWLSKIKQVAGVVSHTTQFILAAPLKLPAKIVAAVKYIGLLSGLVQTIELEAVANE